MFPDHHLVVCVLRPVLHRITTQSETVLQEADKFYQLSQTALTDDRNPLPNWERRRLASIAINSERLLTGHTTTILRHRPDLSWETSIEDLPANRTWVFNITAEPEFNQTKLNFYRSKGENVVEVNVERYKGFEGSTIRNALRTGDKDFSFLPNACLDYFRGHILNYFAE
jgi:hypothetical protein